MKVPYNDLKRTTEILFPKFDKIFADCLYNNKFIGGSEIAKFEDNFTKTFDVKNVVSCGNGTDALIGALRAINLKPDDEVIIPAMTWISSAEVVNLVGAKPVFCDVDEHTMVAELKDIQAKITNKTKAVILVHLYGNMPIMAPIIEYLNELDIILIEDCAQAHLSSYKGVTAGNFGRFGTFSFYPGKNLGAIGDAGAICARDEFDAQYIRKFFNHGASKKHLHEVIGTNSRLDTLQASILTEKLAHLKLWTSERIKLAKIYENELQECRTISINEGVVNSFHIFPILVEDRAELLRYFDEMGIGYNINYPVPLHKQPCYKLHNNHKLPIAEMIAAQQVSLPLFPGMTESEQQYVIDKLNLFFRSKK